MAAVTTAGPLAPLGRTRWSVWREIALRGAGFPAARLAEICDDELAAAADQVDTATPATGERYERVFAAATARLSSTVAGIATEPTFREAVTSQNPAVVRTCLDKAASGEPRTSRGRQHELTIATYLQRYCLKNESISFFGPIGWARLVPEDFGVSMEPAPQLLSRRTTYFEYWAIDAIAEMVAAWPEVWPWLRPTTVLSTRLAGGVLRMPFRKPATLSAVQRRVLRQCDGQRTVRDITGDPPDPAVVAALLWLREVGAVEISLKGPVALWPERFLAERIAAIGDEAVRSRAMAPLAELMRAREVVGASAGDADRLAAANQALGDTFERLTGAASQRLPGEPYAGRTLVYEDAIRAGEVRIGQRFIDRIAEPLGLVLDSAAWLANTVADRYEQRARQAFERELGRFGGTTVPLLHLLSVVMPEMLVPAREPVQAAVVDEVVAEFQRRWRRIVGLPDAASEGLRHHRVGAADIAGAVAREFPEQSPRWSGVRWCSPDVMLAVTDPSGLAIGDVDVVLGELHCATNTLESQIFPAQHPCPDRLREAALASGLDDRIFTIPPRDSPLAVTSRFARAPELMLPTYTYLAVGAESMTPPAGAKVLYGSELTACVRDGALMVHDRVEDRYHRFLDVVGELLNIVVVNGFRPFDDDRHLPRVSIDRLVVSREAWKFPASALGWAAVIDERQRYARVRRWRREQGLPERFFCRVPVERKPVAVDLRSLPLVNMFAKLVRRTERSRADATITLTEVLPDVEQLWLRDRDGERYTAELRMVTVAQR
ncbi:hypothetical protein CA850_23225 [Micromonospora echinospora]|uniref:Lantibiotic dehydratase, C terminus n=1 Tax=Micromonospora echinospora TaxID=1877 RepID=A0A1C4YSF0_MICEC|nr:lantibiotic dehydratase [Micromonospora echinospora]OZV77369.1 hypothetical protein CA850_23225 [Micromonospora echinospora]SCF23586.1 Lantibiotic dehydratase, C terminus [Micromonospora echinospora]